MQEPSQHAKAEHVLARDTTALSVPRASGPKPAGDNAVEFSDVLSVIRHWWWQCSLAGVCLAAISCGFLWFTFQPIYESAAWLEIKSEPVYVAYEPRSVKDIFAQTQVETISSPVVLSKVAATAQIARLPELLRADSPRQWLEDSIQVAFVGKSELCKVSFRAHDPHAAMLVTNAVVNSYLSLQNEVLGEHSDKIISLLTEERNRRQNDVKLAQELLRNLTKSATGEDALPFSSTTGPVIAENPILALEQRRTEAEVERAILEAQLKAQETIPSGEGEIPALELERVFDVHPELQTLKSELLVERTTLREHRRVSALGGEDPACKRMERKIADLEQAIQQAQDELRPRIVAELASARNAGRIDAIAEFKASIDNQRSIERLWQDRIDEQRKKLEKLGNESLELEFARSELRRAEQVYERIAERITILRTERRAPLRVNVLKSAERPERPLQAMPLKQLGLAVALSLCLPCGLAFLWERRVRRIGDAGRLKLEANVPLLGEVAMLPSRSMLPGRQSEQRMWRDRVTFEESVDALRVALTLSPDFADLRVLMITSAVSREGKTSLAFALAVSMARALREPTLLIDGDMRAPDLHELFHVNLEPGLADVLSQTISLDQAICATGETDVDLLSAGRLTTSPHSLLKGRSWHEVLAAARSRYRYVVVDAPPVLAASESLMLAREADGVLLCTMRDVSRAEQLRMARDRLAAAGAKLLGTVMSGVPTQSWARRHGGYGYGWNRYVAARPAQTRGPATPREDEETRNEFRATSTAQARGPATPREEPLDGPTAS